jgi:DNA-binding MarR family transcriptional regulator
MSKASHMAVPTRPKTYKSPEKSVQTKGADSAVQVLRHFRSVFNAVKTHFQQVEKRAGVGGAQVWALSTIQAQPSIGVNELALALDIHQSTASNLVKGLLKLELVKAEKNGADRRAVQLYTLPSGRRLLKKVPGPFAGVLPKALSELDSKTLARLEKDLSALLKLLNTDERAAKTPLASL